MRAVRWSGGSWASTLLDGSDGSAEDTNSDGSVIVGNTVRTERAGLVWLAGKQNSLAFLLGSNPDIDGVSELDLSGVSDDGKIVAVSFVIGVTSLGVLGVGAVLAVLSSSSGRRAR